MKMLKASVLIKDLKDNKDQTSQLFLEKISHAVKKVGKRELTIEIDSDEDFPVNGGSEYKESFIVEDFSYKEVYLDAINKIDFGNNQEQNDKLKRFLKLVKSTQFLKELENTGSASGGGNQSIDVYVTDTPSIINVFDISIDLSQ